MARMQGFVDRESLPESARAAHDEILLSRKRILGPIEWVLPHTPDMAVRMAALGDAVRKTSVLKKDQVQLAACIAAHRLKNAYLWQAHARGALKAGVSQATLDALATEGALEGLPEEDALIIRYGRELAGAGELSADTFHALQQRFGNTGVMELAMVLGYYLLVTTVAQTAGVKESQ